jgi:hypothetical protein
MRFGFVFLGLLSLEGGCIYVGGRNHAPEGEVSVQEGSAQLWKGGGLTLDALIADPDDDALSYDWSVHLDSTEDGHRYSLNSPKGPDNLDASSARIIATGPRLTLSDLPHRGSYEVELVARDPLGAETRHVYSFVLENEAPTIRRIRFSPDETIHPVHATYQAWLASEDVDDRESDLTCGGKGQVSWEIVNPDPSTVLYQHTIPCKNSEIQDGRFLFRLNAALLGEKTELNLRVTVQDGYGGTGRREERLELTPNRPPCLMLPQAEEVLSGMIPVIYDDPQHCTFDAGRVDDDVSEGVIYTWLVRDEGSVHFSPLSTVQGPLFSMPSWFRPPGQKFQLRVAVQDLYSPFPSCDEDDLTCREGDGLAANCYQWITWFVEVR